MILEEQKASIDQHFSHLGKELLEEIKESGTWAEIPKNTEILKEGQYVKVVPLLTKGLIKVFSHYDDKELLLYYIQPNESCVMSFSASLKNEPSKVYAVTEEDSSAILLPVEKVGEWIKQHPRLNDLFFQQYNTRYSELLNTINHLIFNSLDERILVYLKNKIQITQLDYIKITHRQIASELGTAREVVSRILKKLEVEKRINISEKGITIV